MLHLGLKRLALLELAGILGEFAVWPDAEVALHDNRRGSGRRRLLGFLLLLILLLLLLLPREHVSEGQSCVSFGF